jgi:hypothetical protein
MIQVKKNQLKQIVLESVLKDLLIDINKLTDRNMIDIFNIMRKELNESKSKKLFLLSEQEKPKDEETPEEEGGEGDITPAADTPEQKASGEVDAAKADTGGDSEQDQEKSQREFPSEVPDLETQLEYLKELDRDIQDIIDWLRNFRTEITGLRSGDASVPEAEAPDGLGLGPTFDPNAAQGDPDDPLAGAGSARQTGFTAAQKDGLLKYGKEWLKSSADAPLPIMSDEGLGKIVPEMLFWFGVDPVAAYNKYVNRLSRVDIQSEIEKSKKTKNPIAAFSRGSQIGQLLGELAMLAKDPPSGGDQSKIALRAILGRDTPYGSPGELQSAINTSDATKTRMLNALEKKEPYKIDNYYFSDGNFPELLYQLIASELVRIQQTEGLTGEMAQKMTEESPIIQVALYGSGQSNMEINMPSLQDVKKTGSIILKKLLDSFPNPEGVRDDIAYMVLAARSQADIEAGTFDPTAKIYMELIGNPIDGEEGGEPSDVQKQASADQEVKKVLQSASKLNTKALAFLPDEKMKKVFDALSGIDGGAALTSIAVNPKEREGAQPTLQQAYLRYFAEKDQQLKKMLDEIEKTAKIEYKRIESEGGEEFESLEEFGIDEEKYVIQQQDKALGEKAEELFNDPKVKRYNSLGDIDRFKFEVNIFKELISKGIIDDTDVQKLLDKKGEKDIFRSDKLAKFASDYALRGDDALKENKKPTIKKDALKQIIKEEIVKNRYEKELLVILEKEGFLSKLKSGFASAKDTLKKSSPGYKKDLEYNYKYIQALFKDVEAIGGWIEEIRKEISAVRSGKGDVPKAEEPKDVGSSYGMYVESKKENK